jgi:hypothetical protein
MRKITKFWTLLKFWLWGATKYPYFDEFSISVEPPLLLRLERRPPWSDEKLVIRIAICTPRVITSFPWEAVKYFAEQENILPKAFTDEVPF